MEIPTAELLSEARSELRVARFRPLRAQDVERYDFPLAPEEKVKTTAGEERGTSHLCVVDELGNVAAVTTSVNWPFGAVFSAGGIFLNNQLDDFDKPATKGGGEPAWVAGSRNLPGAGRRPVSSMSPTIVFENGAPVLCIGGSGGRTIISGTLQVAYRILVKDEAPEQAVARPRVHPQGHPNDLWYEESLPQEVVTQLASRGHALKAARYGSKLQLIRLQGGRLVGVSDSRKGGAAVGL